MTATSFQIDDAMRLTLLPPEEAVQAYRKKEARVWLDLEALETDELEAWLNKLGVSDMSRRLFLDARNGPGFYPLNKEIFLVITVLANPGAAREVDYLAILCNEHLLLTVHLEPIFKPRQLSMIEESQAWLPQPSIAGLVSSIMIHLSLNGLQQTAALRNAILALEERMDRDPDDIAADEIMNLRSELLVLGAMVSDQLPQFQALGAVDKPYFKQRDGYEYIHCALVNLEAADRSLDWLDRRIGTLRSEFEMSAQAKTNRRLGMLTILSAIFMPMTLLAGIWGMNFEVMPELHLSHGYPIGLGALALIGSGMYLFFRRTGWFD